MNKRKNKKEKEECPLCKVSEETIKKLKEEEQSLKTPEAKIKKRAPWKIIIPIIIFIGVLVVIAFWKFSLTQSLEMTPTEKQSQDKIGADASGTLPEKGVKIGNLAPNFTSEDVHGNKISLSDFRDKKPVLLVFWATWCGYCRKELPDLKAFTQEHQNEIQIIAVSSGEASETIKNYIQKEDVNFLMLLDEQRKIWNQYLIRGTPSHFLIAKDGKIITLRPGLASLNDLETMLKMLK